MRRTEVDFWESRWAAKRARLGDLVGSVPRATRTPYIMSAMPDKGLIVDAGCGDGKWTFYLAEQGLTTVGVDYAVNTLCENQQLRAASDLECRFLGADVSHFPLKGNSVDVYLSIGVWEHFRSEEQGYIALEAHRILRPGGIIVIDVPNWYSPWTITRAVRHFIRQRSGEHSLWQRNMSRNALTRLCESAGFETVRSVNCDVRSSFRRAFCLGTPFIRKRVPNPLYPVRDLLLALADCLEPIVPQIGYTTIYVGRKPW